MDTATHPTPETQTDSLVCPICAQPLGFTITAAQWDIMHNNAGYGWPWNGMLPRGVVFGRYIPSVRYAEDAEPTFYIEPIPRVIHGDYVRHSYTPMHSRCYKTKRAEWVRRNQATCTHERWTELWQTRCPDCRSQQP